MLDQMLDRLSDRITLDTFLISLNQQLFRNIAYLWYSWHFNKAVFVNLYLFFCEFDSWEYQF